MRTASVAGLSLPLPTRSLDPKTGVHAHLPQGTVPQRARGARLVTCGLRPLALHAYVCAYEYVYDVSLYTYVQRS